jgi:predicted nucleic acid-binding protein
MKTMVDLNVILDVIQHREPHYGDSAQVVDAVVRNWVEGIIASHSVTTLYYVIDKNLSKDKSREVIEWALRHFGVEAATHLLLRNALALQFADYEDAVVNALAESADCDYIVTRNVKDFSESTVPVITPTRFLEVLRISLHNEEAD